MYIPEINFLKDRTGDVAPLDEPGQSPFSAPEEGLDPLLVAFLACVAFLVIITGTTVYLNNEIGAKTASLAETQGQITAIQGEVQALKAQEAQLQEYQGRSQAVINLFDLSKPWSAVLEDLRRRVPSNVWLENFTAQGTSVDISGRALDYTQVAAFQLTLSASPFVSSVEIQDTSQQPATGNTPSTVSYRLTVALKQQGIGQYAQALEESGSVGLLEKLRRLQKENLIQ